MIRYWKVFFSQDLILINFSFSEYLYRKSSFFSEYLHIEKYFSSSECLYMRSFFSHPLAARNFSQNTKITWPYSHAISHLHCLQNIWKYMQALCKGKRTDSTAVSIRNVSVKCLCFHKTAAFSKTFLLQLFSLRHFPLQIYQTYTFTSYFLMCLSYTIFWNVSSTKIFWNYTVSREKNIVSYPYCICISSI